MTTNNKVIRFHREDQTIKFPWGSSFILLKRPGTSYIDKISTENILIDPNGKPITNKENLPLLDILTMGRKMMYHCIVGWENVLDAETNEEIPFDDNVVEGLIERPEYQDIVTDLREFLIGLIPKVDKAKKAKRQAALKN